MTISDLMKQRVLPFEVQDSKIIPLFSFFLHSAPTIKSKTAMVIDEKRLDNNWQSFFSISDLNPSKIYSSSYSGLENACEKNGLGLNAVINRRTKGYVCIRDGKESDYSCLLRHIRNSIAHNNIFYSNAGNRKFVLFEDYNKNGKLTAKILFSQTMLATLKKEITK